MEIKIYAESLIDKIAKLAEEANKEAVPQEGRYIELPHDEWRLFLCEMVTKEYISMPIFPFAINIYGVVVFEEKP